MDKEIYTGADQWNVADAGYCEYCRRQVYCTKANGEGCTVRRRRLEKEKVKQQIEDALAAGLTPQEIGLTKKIIEKYGIEVPEAPEMSEIPEAETFAPGGSDIDEIVYDSPEG